MSLKLNERYPGRYSNPSADYPQGSFKNRTTPTAKDGSYLEQDWANDKEGFFQSLLATAVIEANGAVDKVGASQAFDALLQLGQSQAGVAFTAGGTATALTLTPTPAIQAYAVNQRFSVKFNVTAGLNPTLNVSAKGPKSLKQYDSAGAKVAAAFVADQISDVVYDGTDMVVLDPLPLASKTAVVGSMRKGKMSVTTASASATYTADEIVVETALGGSAYQLSGFSKVINLATTGAGGMDTGTAPVSGYVALYAIYNPTTAVSALLAVNATSSVAPNIYGGANMPAGYTASALLTVLPTNASSQFKICIVRDRSVFIAPAVLFTNNSTVTNQVVSISGVVPQNAMTISGQFFMSSTVASVLNLVIQPDTSTVGQLAQSIVVGANAGMITSYAELPVNTPQQFVVTTSSTAGTPTFTVYAIGYSI